MKNRILLFVLILTSSFAYCQNDYVNELLIHRELVDNEFGDTAQSILPDSIALKFTHLNYFKPNINYKVKCRFKKSISQEFNMLTSKGENKKFRRYGYLKFKLKGKRFKLPIYQNIRLMKLDKYKDYIFIPFTDLTSGNQVYGGGRYVETTIPHGKKYILDFNYAFNPYCHYTSGYNCPIPPSENFLNIEILAGEKTYNKLH
jgi:uncharacterized protein (DUF1684 family)